MAILSALSFIKPITMLDFLNGRGGCANIINSKLARELEYIIRQEKVGFDKSYLTFEALTSCATYIANKVHDRIIRQSGLFVVCGLNINNIIEKFLNQVRKKMLIIHKI